MNTNPTSAQPNLAKPYLTTLANLATMIPLSLFLAACGGGGGGGDPGAPPATSTVGKPYVGDDVGDYTFKYTTDFQGYKTDGKPYGTHYGYREPKCKYLQEDIEDARGFATKIVLGEYTGTKLNPAKEGDRAVGLYAYRETYDFKVIDKTHMSFTHKISLYPLQSCSSSDDNSIKRGEITRTGENTNKPTIPNPHGEGASDSDFWDYFLLQRTGTTMFTWMGKTKLPTGEEVDMFDVDLPELTNRNWDFQKWSERYSAGAAMKLSHPLFNGKNKAKALVYMRRFTDPEYSNTTPWGNNEIKIIMDPSNYMTSVPLAQWQKFENFDPEDEDMNKYYLPD